MKTLVFVTVGTSIIGNNLKTQNDIDFYQHEIEGKDPAQNYRQDAADFKRRVLQSICQKAYDPARPSDNNVSAEFVTLHMMVYHGLITPQESIIAMLYSETLDGKLSAELNQIMLQEKLGFTTIRLYELAGINTMDGQQFSKVVNRGSIPGLLKQIDRETMISGIRQLFCFSGGYKGLIPIIANYARDKHVNMYYIFENSETLIQYRFEKDGVAETVAYDYDKFED